MTANDFSVIALEAALAVETLTATERAVLVYVGKGFTNNEIAELIKRAPSTINDHLKAIFKKLGVDNRVEAAVLACKAGWL